MERPLDCILFDLHQGVQGQYWRSTVSGWGVYVLYPDEETFINTGQAWESGIDLAAQIRGRNRCPYMATPYSRWNWTTCYHVLWNLFEPTYGSCLQSSSNRMCAGAAMPSDREPWTSLQRDWPKGRTWWVSRGASLTLFLEFRRPGQKSDAIEYRIGVIVILIRDRI